MSENQAGGVTQASGGSQSPPAPVCLQMHPDRTYPCAVSDLSTLSIFFTPNDLAGVERVFSFEPGSCELQQGKGQGVLGWKSRFSAPPTLAPGLHLGSRN